MTTGATHTIPTLANSTEYTVRVRSRKSSPANTGEWSDAAKGTPADETLTVSAIGATGATLTIGNYGGAWHHKHTTPSNGTCSSTAVPAGTDRTTVSGLSPDTAHVFKAYSDGGCATELAAASSFTTLLAKVTNVTVSARDKSLAVSWDAQTGATGYDVQWKSGNEDWSAGRQASVTSGASHTIPTLTNSTEYTVRVRWKKGGKTGEWSDTAKGTPAGETLTVSAIGATGATLTIGNYGGSWHYRHTTPSTGPGASCSATAVPAGTDKTTVSGLSPDTAHVFKAYSDGGCATELATASSFTTLLAKVTNVTVSARNKSLAVSWDAQSGATGYDVQWKSGNQDWSSSREASVTSGESHTIPTLTNAVEYTIRVRSKKSGGPGKTGEWSDEAKGTPAGETLTVSAITSTGATLTIGNHGGAWRHKYTSPNGGTCSSEVAAGTSSATVSTLTADTAYTFKAYSDGACATLLATASSFTTLLAKVANVSVSARDRSLAVTWDAQSNATGYDVEWKSGAEEWSDTRRASVTTGATHTIPTLANATEYTVRVRSRKSSPANTGEWSDEAKGTPADETLTVTNIGATGATLTIGNYGGAWYHRHTTPATGPGASCSATAVPAGTDRTTVSDPVPDTAHVFKAYSDGGCATELAAASSFTTLLAKVANVTVSARDKSLAVTWDARTGATGYDVQWKSGNEEWSATRQSSATGTSATITTLTNAMEYTVRVRWRKGAKTGEWSDEAKGTPADETLTVSNIGSTGATLTIGNHGGAWHYRHTTPSTGPGASCSATAVPAGTDNTTVSGLSPDTAHVFKAYSDGACTNSKLLATASSFTTLLAKVANVSVSPRDRSLAVSWDAQAGATGYDVQWKSGNQDWSSSREASVTSGESHTIPTLTNAVEYTIRVRSKKSGGPGKTGEWSDEAKGTPAGETLTVSAITSTGATLTIGNHGGAWRYKYTSPNGGTCSSEVAAGTSSATVSTLTADTAYTFKAYSDGTCATELATASSFTTLLAKVANVRVSARDKSLAVSWDAQSNATGYDVEWKSGAEEWSDTRRASVTTGATHTIPTLANATEYTVRVRSRKSSPANTGEWSDAAKGTPADETLTVTNIGATGATLTIGNHGGAWRHKYTSPNGGTCSSEVAAGTSSATVSTLTADTAYTFKAYSDGTCATELATASSFTTLLAKVANVRASARNKSLAVSWDAQSGATGYDVQWKSGNQDWSSSREASVASGESHTIPTLTNAVEYTIRVRSKKSGGPGKTGEWSDEAKGTPAGETLTVSAITSTGATLTIGNHGGAWRYKYTSPNGGTCSSEVAAGTSSATVSTLTADTAYTFKAYSDGTCATELATASSFTTLLAKVSNVSVSARDKSLAVSWDAQTGATGYDVQWKSGNQDWSSSREASVASGESHTIPTLTNAVEYTIRVRSKKSGGPGKTGEWSDEAKGTPAGETLTVSNITSTGATLTIGNYGGAWYHRHTTPATGPGASCSATAVPAGTDRTTVSGLSPDTAHVFKAYSDGGCATELATAAAFATLKGELAFSGAVSDRTYLKGTAIATLQLPAATASTGSPTIAYALTPAPPAGLAFDAVARQITGTPSARSAKTTHTLTATAAGYGPAELGFDIEVLGGTLTFSDTVDDQTYVKDRAIAALQLPAATASTGGPTIAYALTPAPPAGLSFDAAARRITGAPSAYSARTTHTLTATAAGYAPAELDFDIEVPTATLTAGDVTHDSATLTIANHAGDWWHRRTSPAGGVCSPNATAGPTADLANLPSNTDHVFKAYGDAACAVELARESLLTRPGKPTRPAAAAAAGGALTLEASVTGGGTLTRWQYAAREGAGDFGTPTWTDIASTAAALSHTVTGLAAGAGYRFKVRAANASGAGPASDASAARIAGAGLIVVVDGDRLSLVEGGAAGSFTVRLAYAPAGDVAVSTGTGAGVAVAPASLAFTKLNWSAPQTVTVTPVADTNGMNELFDLGLSASGGGYGAASGGGGTGGLSERGRPVAGGAGVRGGRPGAPALVDGNVSAGAPVFVNGVAAAGVEVFVDDDEVGDIELSTPTVLIEEGDGGGSFEANLRGMAPNERTDVSVDGGHLEADRDRLSYTAANHTVPQTVALTEPARYGDEDYASIYSLELRVEGRASRYRGERASLVAIYLAEDARPGARMYLAGAPRDLTLVAGTPVSLVLPPIQDHLVNMRSVSYHIDPALPAGLAFDGAHDARVLSGTPEAAVAETEYTYTAYSDHFYETATAKFRIAVAAAQGIELSTSHAGLSEGGASSTYTVRLPSAPSADVTVAVASDDAGAVTASPATLTFTAANHDRWQTVRLSAVADADGADESATITHGASGGGYDGKGARLVATVSDDDRGLVVSPGSLRLVEGGAAKTFTVALAAEPAGAVAVYAGGRAASPPNPTALAFTRDNWSAPQSVTVTPAQDADHHDNRGRVGLLAQGGGYGDVVGGVDVLVEDDDVLEPPSSVTVTRGDGALEATWPAAANADVYHVTYADEDGTNRLAAYAHPDTAITIGGVDNAKTYTVGVASRNGWGASGWRNSAPAGPYRAEPPEPPASVTVTRGDGALEASWPAVEGATGYHVVYRADGAGWQLAAENHPDTRIAIGGVDNAKTYVVGVRARNAHGDSGWRNSAPAGPHTPGGGGQGVAAMGLMRGPSGHLSNLSTVPAATGAIADGGGGGAAEVPLFPSASDPYGRRGLVRVLNRSDRAGTVRVRAFDDSAWSYAPLALPIGAGAAVTLTSDDLERGNAAKGLAAGTGPATAGHWRLALSADVDIRALAYVLHADGLLTAMHDTVPALGGTHRVPMFAAGRGGGPAGLLRLSNPAAAAARATIEVIDDRGAGAGAPVSVEVPAGRSVTLSAPDLDAGGAGLAAPDGGAGMWRLRVRPSRPITVMSLMRGPAGRLVNLSTAPANRRGGKVFAPLVLAAADPLGRLGVVRVVNRSDRAGTVRVEAFDDGAWAPEPLVRRIGAGAVVTLTSDDLAAGAGRAAAGHWRLHLSADVDIRALAYVLHADGLVTAMHDTAPVLDGVHRVAILDLERGGDPAGELRLVGLDGRPARAVLGGVGDPPSSPTAAVDVPAGGSVTLAPAELPER